MQVFNSIYVKPNRNKKMKTNKDIQAEVEKTLNILNDWKPVETDAFFFTRLSVRIEKRTQAKNYHWFFESPLLRPALIALTVLINVLTINYFIAFVDTKKESTDLISLFTEEYQLNQSTESYIALNDE